MDKHVARTSPHLTAAPHVLYNGALKIAQQTEMTKKQTTTKLWSTKFAVIQTTAGIFSMAHCA